MFETCVYDYWKRATLGRSSGILDNVKNGFTRFKEAYGFHDVGQSGSLCHSFLRGG